MEAVDEPPAYPLNTLELDSSPKPMTVPLSKRSTTLAKSEQVSVRIQPQTSATHPYQIQPGYPLEVKISIENYAEQTDRFYLVCTNLPEDYFTISYPAEHYPVGLKQSQTKIAATSLELQSGAKGVIVLKIHPPADAAVGAYCPVLHLSSAYHSKVGLPEVVYFQIPPVFDLDVTLDSTLERARNGVGVFQVSIVNRGNVERELMLRGKNLGQESCQFTLDPTIVHLAPSSQALVDLTVQPSGELHRPLKGKRPELQFTVEVEDIKGMDLPPEMPHATLLLEPYAPQIQDVFPLLERILLVGGGLSAIALLTWQVFFKSPTDIIVRKNRERPTNNGAALSDTESNTLPEIAAFYSPKPVYKQRTIQTPKMGSPFAPTALGMPPGGSILMNWEITNPDQIKELRVMGKAASRTVSNAVQSYTFQEGQLPKILSQFCTLKTRLSCRNVPTNSRQPGRYTFTLTVVPRQGQQGTTLTKTIENIQIESSPVVQGPDPKVSPNTALGQLNTAGQTTNDALDLAAKPRPANPSTRTNSASTVRSSSAPTQSAPYRQPAKPSPASQSNPTSPTPQSHPSDQSSPRTLTQSPASKTNQRPPQRLSPPPPESSLEDANAIMRGLVKARTNGQINPYTRVWRQVQDAVYHLRRGRTRSQAAQRSGVSLSVLDQLAKWGQKGPPPNTNPASTPASSPDTALTSP